MTAVLTPGSPEWVAERRTGLGGTDMPKILGVSRFGGPMDVFLEKRGLTAPLIETEAMTWGKLLEDPVAREYARKVGRSVRRAADFLRHPEYPFLFSNIDRWSLKRGTPVRVLEVKTAGEFMSKDYGEEGSDQVPPDYLIQVMHYLSVTGKDVGDLAVLIGGQRHRVFTIERDRELIEGMTEIANDFWEATKQGEPPELDSSEGTALYLAHAFADKGTERPMDDDLARLATMDLALKAGIDERTKERETVRNQIRGLMGDNRWAEGLGVRVVYSAVKGRSTVQWDRLLEARGIPQSVVEEFTAVGAPTRALTVTSREV